MSTMRRPTKCPGYPAPIGETARVPNCFPEGVEADGTTAVLLGDQYLRYDIAADRVDPDTRCQLGKLARYGRTTLMRVVWPNGKAYFFRGSQYIRYDIATDKLTPDIPLTS